MLMSNNKDNDAVDSDTGASSQLSHCPDPVPTTNCFSVLSECKEADTNDNSVQDMERPIDTYYDAIHATQDHQNSQNKPKQPLFQLQLSQYREKHRLQHTRKPSFKPQPNVLVIGDSMIKHINGHKLSRSKQVQCSSQPGAKVDDICPHAITNVRRHKPSEIILHVGTNNVKNNAEDIRDKVVSMVEAIQSPPEVPI